MQSASLQAVPSNLCSVAHHNDLNFGGRKTPLLLEAIANILNNNPDVATFDGKELKVFDHLHFLTKLTWRCNNPIGDDELTGKMARLGLIKIQKQKSKNENFLSGPSNCLRFRCRKPQTTRIQVKSQQMRGQLKDTLNALKNDFHSKKNQRGDSMAMIERIYRFSQLNRDIYQMAVQCERTDLKVLEEIELENCASEDEVGEIQLVKPKQEGSLSMCNLHSKGDFF